jgi:rubredoxin
VTATHCLDTTCGRPAQASGNIRGGAQSAVFPSLDLADDGGLAVIPLNEINEPEVSEVLEYKCWVCLICGWIYNEEEGLPEEGIGAGTRFSDIPDTWRCPLCDVGKEDFVAVEF